MNGESSQPLHLGWDMKFTLCSSDILIFVRNIRIYWEQKNSFIFISFSIVEFDQKRFANMQSESE